MWRHVTDVNWTEDEGEEAVEAVALVVEIWDALEDLQSQLNGNVTVVHRIIQDFSSES